MKTLILGLVASIVLSAQCYGQSSDGINTTTNKGVLQGVFTITKSNPSNWQDNWVETYVFFPDGYVVSYVFTRLDRLYVSLRDGMVQIHASGSNRYELVSSEYAPLPSGDITLDKDTNDESVMVGFTISFAQGQQWKFRGADASAFVQTLGQVGGTTDFRKIRTKDDKSWLMVPTNMPNTLSVAPPNSSAQK